MTDQTDAKTDVAMQDSQPEIPEGYVDISGDGGILKKILVEGEGVATPPKGADVEVHYVGTLTNGALFDSSRARDQPFTFALGNGQVIKGWDQGVATMKKGEKANFRLRSDYAYGDAGSPPKIPGKATLVFEVELLSWDAEKDISDKKDGGIMKTIVEEGEGHSTPKDDEKVKVHIEISCADGTLVEKLEDLEVQLGEELLVEGIEQCIVSMKKGETSTFRLQSNYAYGEAGDPTKNIPPNSEILVKMTLLSWESEKPSWEMSVEEKLEASNKRKLEGNECFKKAKYARAIKKYQKALGYINSEYDFKEDEEKEKATAQKIPIFLNMAQCNIKQKNYGDAASNCGKVIDLDDKNVKAHFRRGQAHLNLAEFDQANKDFTKAKELDPENKEVLQHLALLKKKVKEQEEKDKKLYSSMFNGISY